MLKQQEHLSTLLEEYDIDVVADYDLQCFKIVPIQIEDDDEN